MNCRHCSKEIPVNKRKNVFCSRSCAASFNNKVSVKRSGPMKHCRGCNEVLGKKWLTGRQYCDKCKPKHRGSQAGAKIAERKAEILSWIAESDNRMSNQDIAMKLGVRISTWMKWNEKLGINYGGNQSKAGTLNLACNQVFSKGSLCSTNTLKKYIARFNLMESKCKLCDIIDMWNGRPISLHLDHIDGDNSNNELTNLRLLCPNCHSQTDTYCSRNKKREKKSVSDEELLTVLEQNQFCVSRALKVVGMSGAKNYIRIYKLLAKQEITVDNGYKYPQARTDMTYTKFCESRKKKMVPQTGLEPVRS